jgi:hypothetical protein
VNAAAFRRRTRGKRGVLPLELLDLLLCLHGFPGGGMPIRSVKDRRDNRGDQCGRSWNEEANSPPGMPD